MPPAAASGRAPATLTRTSSAPRDLKPYTRPNRLSSSPRKSLSVKQQHVCTSRCLPSPAWRDLESPRGRSCCCWRPLLPLPNEKLLPCVRGRQYWEPSKLQKFRQFNFLRGLARDRSLPPELLGAGAQWPLGPLVGPCLGGCICTQQSFQQPVDLKGGTAGTVPHSRWRTALPGGFELSLPPQLPA